MGHGDVRWTAKAKGKWKGKRAPTGSNAAVDDFIAHEGYVTAEVQDHRDRMFLKAQQIFAKHNQRGGSELTKEDGGWTDRLIVLDDRKGEWAAAAIESRLHMLQYVLMQGG